MDEMILEIMGSYYNALEKLGYMSWEKIKKLLVLLFYRDFVFNDYHGLLSKEDYHLIEKALDCLYGSTCLIPYPDYLKMGKLHIGEITELAQRIKNLENTEVLKLADLCDVPENLIDSDIIIVSEEHCRKK